jgi:hypothetical protein
VSKSPENTKTSDSHKPRRQRKRSRGPRARRRNPILNRIIIILSLVLIIGIGAAALFTPLLGGPYLSLADFSLVRRETVSGHEAVLEQVNELSELQTVEYIYKLVFPHDFFIDGLSVPDLLERSKVGGPGIEDALSPAEYRYYQAYYLARDAGLQPLSGPYDFLVITAFVELGYRLDQLDADRLVSFEEPEAGENGEAATPAQVIRVNLPPAQILQIRIEDPDSSNYSYPDLNLDQQNWGRIAGFVREHVAELPEMDEIREEARNSLIDFFATFLSESVNIQADFSRIE